MERDDIAAIGRETLAYVREHPPAEPSRTLVRMTSGTSGKEPIVLVSNFDAESVDDIDGRTLAAIRTISCLGSRGIRLANVLAESASSEGMQNSKLPLDAADLSDDLAPLLSEFAPNRLYGLSSFIAKLGARMPESVARAVRVIRFSGESARDALIRYFEQRFPDAERFEYYIANEVGGYIGRRSCPYLMQGQFHTGEGVAVEIDSPDDTGAGDILVSRKIYGPFAADRYRVGDIGRLLPAPCRCGRTILELIGRRGIDYVKAGGVLFRREEFDRVIGSLGDLADTYRADVVQSTKGGAPRVGVALCIYRAAGPGTAALERELAERVARGLYVTPSKTYAQLVERGALEPLTVAFESAPFPDGQKDARVRLVDR